MIDLTKVYFEDDIAKSIGKIIRTNTIFYPRIQRLSQTARTWSKQMKTQEQLVKEYYN